MNPEPTAYLVVPIGEPDAAPMAVMPADILGQIRGTVFPLFKREDIAPLRVPMIDQNDRLVGYHHRKPTDLLSEDVVMDDNGTVWQRPTADAYMRVCNAYHEKADENRVMRDLLARLVTGHGSMEEAKTFLGAP